MEILISIGAKIVEHTMTPIGRQVGYLLFYKDNFKELEDQVEKLMTIKEHIKHDIEVERRNGREIEAYVLNWMNIVDETLKDAKQLFEDPYRVNVGCSRWSFLDLKSRHQLSQNAKKMIKDIAKVQEKGKFDRVGYLPPLHIANFIPSTKDSEKLKSRSLIKEDIVLALKDPKVSRTGVFGLSGVGKTTLVEEVGKQVKDDNLFDVVIVATISQTPNFERIQKEITDQIGLRFEEMSTKGRAGRLCERIKMEKTIIIILDDIWTKIDLDKLGIPSKAGCKLLLTSRNQDILWEMETQKDFRLEALNDVESWSLFQAKVGNAVKDVYLQNIGIEVVQRCVGLPVLIVTMAKSLKNKDIHYWKDALNKLKRVDIGEINGTVYSALEFSYNQLEDDEVKEVFLLCGVHGTSIFVSDLLKYVIGLGVFKYINTIEDARNRLYKIISDLKASCLLLDDDASVRVKMHDIVCEVAISIASRDHYVFIMKRNARLQDWPISEDFLERCTQIILIHCCIQKLPEKLNYPNLKFFYLVSFDDRTLEIPNSFFEGTGNLEVLDLTGMIIYSLPTALAYLTKLKTLCLDQCSLKDMVGIEALKNLEILSFIHSSMQEFPSEIRQLTHLRMLDLKASGIEVIPPNILSKLTKLEELYIGDTSIKWEVESSTKQNKNASLAELKHLASLTTLEFQIREAWILPRSIMFEKLERYKIVIGDKWEWLDKNGASRLLKLKLDTNIHLEHGIKALIKSVEDLYLDKINGISNVLFQLNGEGFPLLKHLHIQNNGEIQHIINSIDRNQTHVLFPKLETLILHNLNNLEKICHGPLMVDSFEKLKVFKVKSCCQLKYVFLASMVKEFCQLIKIKVSKCTSMKNIVLKERMDSDITINEIEFIPLCSLTLQYLLAMDGFCSDMPTSFFNAKVSFPNLETLKLSSINLNKIWDDQHSAANSFQNLANLIVENFGSLKYLFSPSMLENLKNLKRLEVSKCHTMEEIISTEGRNNEIAIEEVRFSKLEEIIINDMKNLKTAWHYQFDRVKTLEVNNCEKLESIFPSSSMPKVFGSLEILKVSDCALVEEIFQLTANGMHIEGVTTQLKNLVLSGLPKMKQIWSRDSQGILRFSNLQVVQIEDCENLEYLFPFSIAKDLSQLERLKLNECGIKEVVSKKDGPMEEAAIFELNHLTSLNLTYLDTLKGFYAGPHTLECQSLKILHVFKCNQLKLFDMLSNRCQESSADDQRQISMLQPLFTFEEVIGNLEELTLNSGNANMILQHQVPRHLFCKLKLLHISTFEDDKANFPYWFLENVPNLETLVVEWSSFEEIFYDETLTGKEGQNKISTRLKTLSLWYLPELQGLCREGCQIHPVLKVLEALFVQECSNLRNLVPSSATFCHLAYLEISNCNSLINLITSSTARSLVKLQTMKLKDCNSLEEIVTQEAGDTEDEIEFSSLEILKLECLPKLYSFSSSKYFLKFPSLEVVVVMQCPKVKIFSTKSTSTPKLKKVLTEEKDDGEFHWEGDLNGTINKMFLKKVAFHSFKHLELAEYPELKELWYGQVGQELFRNLKSLVVQNCYWLSNILLSLNILQTLPNLEALEVRDCDTLKAVFDLGDINERAMVVRETTQLKKITLCNLHKLKYIWKHDFQEIVSFGNPVNVHAGECQGSKMSEAPGNENKGEKGAFPSFQLLKLISSNLLQLLQSLEELEVRDCDSLEAVFDVKVMDDKEMHVKEASQLKKLALSGLPNLIHIWNKDPREILSFRNLQVVRIAECQNLKILFSVSLCQDLQQLEELNIEFCGFEEIVAIEEEGSEDLKFDFPQLIIFRLIGLTQLKSFYPRRHTLECPSLKTLNVYCCEILQIFAVSHLDSQQTLRVDEVDMPIQQALFPLEKVPPNLKELALNEKDSMRILNGHHEANFFHSIELLRLQCFQETPIMFLNNFLERFPNTTTLQVRDSSFKVLFSSKGIGYCSTKRSNQIKNLWLYQLEQLKHIWNDDSLSDPLVQNLEYLSIGKCSSLTSLAPPSISFTSLTTLQVEDCHGLTYLMTSSTTKSLVHLTVLRVTNCEKMEEVVLTEEGMLEEITFESLKYMQMTSLPRLKRFCSGKHTFVFPSLEKLIVTGWPKMLNFLSEVTIIAPKLRVVDVENEKMPWKEDLNTTIKQFVMAKE